MTPTQIESLTEIRRLLKEAYDDYFRRGDGHCKSDEGAIELSYPNYFEECDGKNGLVAKGITIYSYVLGPSRRHHWFKGRGSSDYACKWVGDRDPLEAALEDVRQWYKDQMESESDE